MASYVISDIHGRLKEFKQMLKQMKLDTNNDKLYMLGDYVDWGPNSIEVIQLCMELSSRGQVECLIGNHDKMMLDCIKNVHGNNVDDYLRLGDNHSISIWLNNGGYDTLQSYCNNLTDTERDDIINWISSLKYTVPDLTVGDNTFYLCHASPKLKGMSYDDVIWNRINPNNKYFRERIKNTFIDTTVICGHTIVSHFGSMDNNGKCIIYKNSISNIICIDCGAKVIGLDNCGRLAGLRLDDMKEFYV